MTAMKLSLRLVLAITSPTALLEVNKTPSLIRAIHGLQSFWPILPLTVAVASDQSSAVYEILERHKISHELLVCDPTRPANFAASLAPECQNCDALLIHDASRPLTNADELARIFEAFTSGVDAVRPAITFTETLKIVEPNSTVIRKTLDRTSVKRISTPELIRTSVIDIKANDQGWFLPLKKSARIEYVEGSPEGLRINSEAERDLLESFLHWRQTRASQII